VSILFLIAMPFALLSAWWATAGTSPARRKARRARADMTAGVALDPPGVVDDEIPGHWPPRGDGGEGGGDGDGGGDGGGGEGPWGEGGSGPPISKEKLGLLVLIAALSMLFAGMLAGYVVYRASAREWPPKGFPALPRGLWFSTVVIAASSVTLVWADRSLRRGQDHLLRLGLGLTTVLGFLFLVTQAWLWGDSVRAGLTQRHLYGALFFVATGAHALHVLGGLFCLLTAWLRALRVPAVAALRQRVELTGLYWHFVGVLWFVLFGVLYLGG
jgi:cytochrome c oxidase subunit 3